MRIRDLRNLLSSLSLEHDDCEIVRAGGNHYYFKCSAHFTSAELNEREYYEYFDDLNMGEKGNKVSVLLFE
jgi:hypothetical protein